MQQSEEKEFELALSSVEAAVAFAKELRSLADSARNKFYRFVAYWETRPAAWSTWTTFERCWADCHLGSWSAFTEWKVGRGRVKSAETAEAIGSHGVRHVGRVPEEKVSECIARMTSTVQSEGTTLGPIRARQIAQAFLPPSPVKGALSAVQLKKENDRLKRKVARLETENAQLRERLAGAQNPGAARSRRSAKSKGDSAGAPAGA